MFDSKEELYEKIRLGEDSVLELKAVRFRGDKVIGPRRDDLADELAAFANTNEGILVLGIDDTAHEVEGIPLERLDAVEDLLRSVCNDSIKPPLGVRIIRLQLPDSAGAHQPVIRVDIPRSLFVHKSPGGYMQRVGSSKREMSPEILARLFQQRSQARLIRFDEQAVPDTSLSDLTPPLWERFTRHTSEPAEAVLLKRNILTRDSADAIRASVAGVLMCSEEPDACLPGAFIEAVRYVGTEADSDRQLDAQQIRGPLDEQIRQAMRFLVRNQRVAATKEPYRVEHPQFSVRAAFEALVNAVAHRDYSIHGSKIRFFMFDDRLELYSPGPLPNTVTIESLSLRQSTRNELVTSLLTECPVRQLGASVGRTTFLERRGEGVPIILKESEALSGRRPVYRLIDDAELVLTIFSAGLPEASRQNAAEWPS